MLSSTARIDKSKRKRKDELRKSQQRSTDEEQEEEQEIDPENDDSDEDDDGIRKGKSRDRTGKRDTSEVKKQQVHREQIAAFRRSMAIRLANKHDPDVPYPFSSFHELMPPSWWNSSTPGSTSCSGGFHFLLRPILVNIEAGRWTEPTPIQMQSIPTLLSRRDFIGAAPTGSGCVLLDFFLDSMCEVRCISFSDF